MASRSLQSSADAFGGQPSMIDACEGKSCESSGSSVFGLAASAAPTEMITRSYNPNKKFWQTVPKLDEEKPPKQANPNVRVVVDMKGLRAQAIAKVNAEKGTIELKTKAPDGAWMQTPPQANFFPCWRSNKMSDLLFSVVFKLARMQ